MGKYRLSSIAQLARQMPFAPTPRRLEQLNAAEDLLLKLSPEQTYTITEVICAITGYQPKQPDSAHLTGIALQHDLGILLEEVSESLQLHINGANEPVLSIEEVAQRLSVTTKTVQRWRRRGLPARRYTYAEGKRRIGFRISSVQRFVGSPAGTQQIEPAHSDKSLTWLLERAESLASSGHWESLAAQRLARQGGGSPAALIQILREHAPHLQFAEAPSAQARSRVIELREQGCHLSEIASELRMPQYGVYRIMLEQRLGQALRKRIRFYDDPLYHQDNAAAAIDAIIAQEPAISPPEVHIPRDLPTYLRDLYRIAPLSPSRERGLFLQYHYLRLLAARRQAGLDVQASRYRDLKALQRLRREARLVRARIVETHLRLVVSVAKKHLRSGIPLMDLISEGNLTLMRAVDSFDIHRGTRFSTYAVYAIMRGFARYVPQAIHERRNAIDPELLGAIGDPAASRAHQQSVARDELAQLLSQLDQREREVLSGRFGLRSTALPMSSRELGTRMHLSSQRILQIEQRAMDKLRLLAR